jgi:uncharacterized protein YjgD (DUF1641 family)
MAHPITFKPQPVDPKQELMRELDAAPREHAEALLVAYDLLQTAHDKGVLDLLQGLVGGRDVLAGKVGEAIAMPESIAALRNVIALGRILASIDPDLLHRLSKAMAESAAPMQVREKENTTAKTALHATPGEFREPPHHSAPEPPSLWQIFKRASSKDGRRGLALAVSLLTGAGRALDPESSKQA